MNKEEKVKEVEWLTDQFRTLKGFVLTDFTGLTVSELNTLRADLRAKGATLKVIKNTLARRAMPNTDVSVVAEDIVGPRAAAWTRDENSIPELAKVLMEFSKNQPKLQIIRGVVGGQKLEPTDLEALSKLPPREVLVGRLLGTMIAPVAAFVNTLAAVPRSFLYVLKAIEEQKTAAES